MPSEVSQPCLRDLAPGLLDLVVCEALPELRDVAGLVLRLIEARTAAYSAAQVTRSCFQVISLGAWAWLSAPGPKPTQGMPYRPWMDTQLVEKVHLSVRGPALPQVHGVVFGVRVGVADALVAPQGVVGVHQRLDVGGAGPC